MAETEEPKVCRILSLDGGGAKGFYTLGCCESLRECWAPPARAVDLIFGTSTGAIIASLLALGKSVTR